MKIVVTGGRGLLGSEFARLDGGGRAAVSLEGPVSGISDAVLRITALGHTELDVTDADLTRAVVAERAPDWVIHCAAYTAVDRAEKEPEEAMRVNRGGTVNVAAAAAEAGARMLYLSTDYVFDGRATEPYAPGDPVAPLSVYARTKRAGEEATLAAGGVVVRTGWLYGSGGGDFVDAMLARAERGEPLRVVDDQRGRPTWARNVARTVLELIGSEGPTTPAGGGTSSMDVRRGGGAVVGREAEGTRGAPLAGIWHVADGGDATWLELAREAVRLRVLDAEIEGVSTEEWGAAAPRPAYSVLDLTETERRLGRAMMRWKDALAQYLEQEPHLDPKKSP
jgi:dTDP-4-dehydrorhamnose reductase